MKISDLQIQRNFQNITPAGVQGQQHSVRAGKKQDRPDFNDVLQSVIKPEQEIQFSAHAQKRITSRNITVDMDRLETGLQQLQKKGSKNSLLLIDNDAFLVNVKNKTVITAVDQQSIKNNVFTNIDSVAIV
ncbi:MAG: flagellar protein [Candidatus Marinimicrobia bacterium]|nr:flagellar protein [Candidatus Neomarinimicrobiota bacterium]